MPLCSGAHWEKFLFRLVKHFYHKQSEARHVKRLKHKQAATLPASPPPPSLWDKRDWGRNQALWTLLPAVAVSCIELPEYAIKMQCKPICIISESGLWHSAHQLRLFSTSQSCVCHTHHKHLQCRQSAQTLELCMQLKGSSKTTKITPLLFWRNQVTFFVLNSHQ